MKKQAFEERRRWYLSRFTGPGEWRLPGWHLVTEVLSILAERLDRAEVTKRPHPVQETVLADASSLLGEHDPEYGGNYEYPSEWVADLLAQAEGADWRYQRATFWLLDEILLEGDIPVPWRMPAAVKRLVRTYGLLW